MLRSRHFSLVLPFALFHFGMGLGVLFSHDGLDPTHGILYEMLPWQVRVIGWWFAGLVSLGAVLTRHRATAFILLSIMPAQRFISHLFAAIAYLWPGARFTGEPASIGLVFVWLAFMWVVRGVAGWPDLEHPEDRTAPRRDRYA